MSNRILHFAFGVRAAALALVFVALGACSNSHIAPTYLPQGLLKEKDPSGAPVALMIVDRIENTAPLPSNASDFGVVRYNAPGEQMVCDLCTYKLEASPIQLVRQVVDSALLREGVAESENASRRLEVHVTQFEFFEPKANTGRDLNLEGRVGLRAIVTKDGMVVADRSYLESNVFSPGATMFPGDIKEWVGRTVSSSVEHLLSDAQVSEAMQTP